MKRKTIMTLAALLIAGTAQAAETLKVDVHRDANCGCCKAWIKHLEAEGLTVNDQVEQDMAAVKSQLGVPEGLRSCHTAVINGRFVEGHVPAEQLKALSKRTDLAGIAVPGMPLGSPGMERGTARQAYKVIGITQAGKQETVAEYEAKP
ncbi:DUF411 domain-containing protein [Pseudomonas alliivorans]|uniref:DUF411 domain-containing protein n=1 Tax=Pseudomonas cannabina pv. alisalensis TaxID=757414 RepID=A0ABS1X7U0_PSEC1|nr:DUF411 domain-containing protein [Pseudomonas cannabina]MEE4964495.1 DUF411 domain-containing protein [Pseudomonas alliivorans]MBM0137555.1 DUF411 domain-containing protein [Pseudomonas cannabina pv. alisalensis]MEE4974578.1 DUF411 domain-containing protein [Pseudomonas alliivorans]MEE4979727.1 DUF411 domain-containing protein [Pseudomonas alliivorans]MEE4984820.1 DUF411 domain-containing protein [Pseudomonas alliivorans]